MHAYRIETDRRVMDRQQSFNNIYIDTSIMINGVTRSQPASLSHARQSQRIAVLCLFI